MTVSPLDDYPVHQIPEVMRHVGTSDRNFYDRYYFNAFPLSADCMLIIGIGQYPNLGVTDGFALFRHGNTHRVVRASRQLGADRMDRQVEPQHYIRWQERVMFDSKRMAQTGRWTGSITLDDVVLAVTPDSWWGTRDRSWGIRPVGEPEPAGIQARNSITFYWLYTPIQFEDHSILCILQEDEKGRRVLEEAVRVWADPGRDAEYLGRPVYTPVYAPDTRDVVEAEISFASRAAGSRSTCARHRCCLST